MFKELKKISKSLFKENLVSYNLSPNKRRIIQLYFLYLSFQLYFIISFKISTNFIILKYSYIKLKINGPIYTKIFSSYYVSGDGILNSDCNFDRPNEVHINGQNKTEVSNYILFLIKK